MKKQMKVTLIVIVAAIIVAAAIYIVRYIKSGNDLLTPVGTRAEFVGDTDKYPSMLRTKGVQIVNAEGEQVVLKGVMVPESHRLYDEKII